jgi:hypothetical protein
VRRLSSQVKPMPQSNISKNCLGHHPPQRPGAKKNAREALPNLHEPTSSLRGPTDHVT